MQPPRTCVAYTPSSTVQASCLTGRLTLSDPALLNGRREQSSTVSPAAPGLEPRASAIKHAPCRCGTLKASFLLEEQSLSIPAFCSALQGDLTQGDCSRKQSPVSSCRLTLRWCRPFPRISFTPRESTTCSCQLGVKDTLGLQEGGTMVRTPMYVVLRVAPLIICSLTDCCFDVQSRGCSSASKR